MRKLDLGRDDRHAADIQGIWVRACNIGRNEFRCPAFSDDWNHEWIYRPDAHTVRVLLHRLDEYINKRAIANRRKGPRETEQRKRHELELDPSKAFSHIQPDRAAPVSVLKRADGTCTVNLREIDTLLRDAWSQIFSKHDPDRPEPDARVFIQRYRRFIPNVPQTLHSISLKELKSVLHKLKNCGAAGLDNWNSDDIKALPDVILELLVPLYDMVEFQGKWPYAFTWVAVTLIPKGEGMLPLSQRPLSVLSVVYRIWAAVRVRQCPMARKMDCSRPTWVQTEPWLC